MHRIDGQNHDNNRFQGGDPAQRANATVVTSDWLNAVQEEIVNAIVSEGITLDKAVNTQLTDALTNIKNELGNALPPVGSIIAFIPYNFEAPPDFFTPYVDVLGHRTITDLNDNVLSANWRICDGSQVTDTESPFRLGSGHLPFLSDGRFLQGSNIGATTDYSGGFNEVTLSVSNLPAHAHGLRRHTHGMNHRHITEDLVGASLDTTVNVVTGGTSTIPQGMNMLDKSFSAGPIGPSNEAAKTQTDAATGNTDLTGGTTAFENRPKYLSCYYIMRIK